MSHLPICRRRFLVSAGAVAAGLTVPLSRLAAQAAVELPSIPIPPPIAQAERLERLAKARALMARHGIGAIIVEPGASLDYFTGVQWWRSERLTAAVIPAHGDPIIVTPFFERPSVAESLSIPAEIRTWNEDEEPLKLVAGFLRSGGLPASRSDSRRPTAISFSTASASNCPRYAWSAATRWCAAAG